MQIFLKPLIPLHSFAKNFPVILHTDLHWAPLCPWFVSCPSALCIPHPSCTSRDSPPCTDSSSSIVTCSGPANIFFSTRLHSSRMRTVRSSSRLLGGGVSISVHAGIPPQAWAWRPPSGQTPQPPPGYGPGDTSQPDPPQPPGYGPRDPLDPPTSPLAWAWIPPPGQTPQPPLGYRPGDPPVDRQTRVKT